MVFLTPSSHNILHPTTLNMLSQKRPPAGEEEVKVQFRLAGDTLLTTNPPLPIIWEKWNWGTEKNGKAILRPFNTQGFSNGGDLCWLNSSIQALVHHPRIAQWFKHYHHPKECRVEKCLACSFHQLLDSYWTPGSQSTQETRLLDRNEARDQINESLKRG